MSSKNVGRRDAGIRRFLGLALLLTSASLLDRPLAALGVGFIALILIGTALLRTCPLYTVLRMNTCPLRNPPE